MEQKNSEIVINLKDLWAILVKRLWLIVLVALLVVAGTGVYKTATYSPLYESTAMLYILPEDANSTSAFSLGLSMISDCTEALKSFAILNEVIDDLDLKVSSSTLRSRISTSNTSGTRVLYVSVKGDTPEQAKAIVDDICKVCADKMQKANNDIRLVNVFEQGTISGAPCNKTGKMIYIVAGALAAFLVYAVFIVIYLLDDKFRDKDDVEKTLELTILGEIPDFNGSRHGAYGSYGSRGAYKAYGAYGAYGARKSGSGSAGSKNAAKKGSNN